ncbi:MAG: TetR/AcrR family transcriptional regulator, partial [Alphaproteobacteria bacterium]|nr:TetR/AcrR family transcriptional regulator [Alphaproteobacteria bacterium]
MSAPAVEIKKGRKFDQVLEGARRIFMRDGFEGASVDEIAREAQVSKATLYSYFPDKRLLFSEVARLECNRQAEEALAVIGKGATIEHVLREAGTRILRFFLSDFGQQVFRICVAESHRFPELGRRFFASGPDLVRERLSKVLRPYVEAGILKIDDMDLAANQFGELCKGD